MIDWTKVIITVDDDTVAMAAGQVLLLASGVPGESASVEVVETVTLDPLEDADVENVGDSRNVKLKFKIPRGQSGVWGGIGGTLEDQADLKQALDAKADIIHTSASGSLVHITDGAAYPVDSLTVGVDPVQDLHGYDSPWPAGGGKNLYNADALNTFSQNGITATVSNGKITLKGTASANAYFTILNLGLPSGNYVFSVNNPTANSGVHTAFQNANGNYFADGGIYTSNKVVTITSRDINNVIIYVTSGTSLTDFVIQPQLEVGSTATSWTPYSNVCPISGHSSATVTRAGVNIWDEEWEEGTISGSDGQNASDNTRIRSKNYISVTPSTQYYVHGTMDLFYYDSSKAYIGNSVGVSNTTFTASAKCRYIRFRCPTTYGTTYNNDISINYPATDTAYHAGHVQTVTIALGDTYYGAQLDVLTGTLTVDRVSVTWNSKTGWNYRGSDGIFSTTSNVPDYKKSGKHYTVTDNAISNWTTVYDQSGGWADTAIDTVGIYSSTNDNDHVVYIRPSGGTFTTVDELDTYLSGNPLQVVFTLATPTVITGLTPETISLLLGENNVWSGTGNTAIGYRADTKLYIDSKLAAAIAELQALILEH